MGGGEYRRSKLKQKGLHLAGRSSVAFEPPGRCHSPHVKILVPTHLAFRCPLNLVLRFIDFSWTTFTGGVDVERIMLGCRYKAVYLLIPSRNLSKTKDHLSSNVRVSSMIRIRSNE